MGGEVCGWSGNPKVFIPFFRLAHHVFTAFLAPLLTRNNCSFARKKSTGKVGLDRCCRVRFSGNGKRHLMSLPLHLTAVNAS